MSNTQNINLSSISKMPAGLQSKMPAGLPSKMPAGLPTKMPAGLPTKMPAGLPSSVSPKDITKLAKLNPASLSTSLASSALAQAGMQSPATVMINYLLLTMYTLVGSIIYYPSFIASLPESTLEESLPKHDLCMKMGGSERICKKKIKCLFKNCHYLDDPIGYKLDKRVKKPCNKKGRQQQSQHTKKTVMMGGNGRKKNTRKYFKKNGWRKYLSYKMIKKLQKEYKKNILRDFFGQHKINKTQKKKKFFGGNKSLKQEDCINKINQRLCSTQDEEILYLDEPDKLSNTLVKQTNKFIPQFGGGNEEKIKQHIIDLIKEHNKELHKKIEENPEQVSNIISEIKKKYPSAVRTALMFPDTIKKFSGLLVPYIQKFDVSNISDEAIKSMNVSSMLSSSNSSENSSQNENVENISENTEVQSEEDKKNDLKERKLLIRSFFVEQIKSDTLFKLTIIIKVMQILFKDNPLTDEEKEGIGEQVKKQETSVVFPWNFNNPTLGLKDKIKCMSSHITQTKFEREQNPDLYDKCFVCKHCTLRNTASKVWGDLIKGLLSGNKAKQFTELINNTFGLLREHIDFPFMTEKQYYLTTLISLQLASENLDIGKINSSFRLYGNNYELKDLIVGIPSVSIIDKNTLRNYMEDLRNTYVSFYKIGIVDDIHGIYYESLLKRYFEIEYNHRGEKLEFLKEIALNNYNILYLGRKGSRQKAQGIYDKLYENKINSKEMNYFSHFEKNQTLNNLKDASNYRELNQKLNLVLRPQYIYLLKKSNFDYNSFFRNNYSQTKNDKILKNIVMKLF